MYRKTLLCTALVLAVASPIAISTANAASSVSAKAALSDTAITAKIKALYAQSPLVNAAKVHVTTTNHTVALSGQVNTKSEYERAITLADSVAGVKAINAEDLSVKASKAPLNDAYTTAKVKSSFLREKRILSISPGKHQATLGCLSKFCASANGINAFPKN